MGSYRPLTDVMILARSRTKYYGSFPGGFLHRALDLMATTPDSHVLHVCGGMVRRYPYRGFGKHHRTLDLDPKTRPDFLQDARDPFPLRSGRRPWDAVLIDRPYTPADAAVYRPGAAVLPNINALLRAAFEVLTPAGRCGVLDYVWPSPPHGVREVAVLAVGTGRNGRARWLTVWERCDRDRVRRRR